MPTRKPPMLTAIKTRILLADDHPALLAETAELLARDDEVVACVPNGLFARAANAFTVGEQPDMNETT